MKPATMEVHSAGLDGADGVVTLTGMRIDARRVAGRLRSPVVVLEPPSRWADASQRDRLRRLAVTCDEFGWEPAGIHVGPQPHTVHPEVEVDELDFIRWLADLDVEDRPEVHTNEFHMRHWAEVPGRDVVVACYAGDFGLERIRNLLKEGRE